MRTGHHCRRLATNRQCCCNHHCRLETNRQCWLAQHCRFEPWTDSVGLLNTAGLSHEPALLKQPSLSVGTTNRQCSTRHCRVVPGTDTVACRSVSVFKNRQWCQPPSLPVCHCRFKIRQWRRFLNRQWCPDLELLAAVVRLTSPSIFAPTCASSQERHI